MKSAAYYRRGMTRDLTRLTSSRFDVLVIGGGIHGLFAAYDAATRGLSVALIDRGDFGGGISFNHQRTLHGGLRALQSGHVRKCREQIHERRAWARIAPHLVRPLPFLIGTYRATKRSRLAVRAGFKAYDLIGRDRNQHVLPELHLPSGRLESAAATRRLFPGVADAGLSGGAIWYDYQTIHPDRLTWCVAMAGAAHGAVLCNYVEATGWMKDGPGLSGVTARDTVTGESLVIGATHVILAAGSGLPALHDVFGLGPAPPLVRAMNLLLDRPARDIALAASAPNGRMYTAVPWQGYVLVGTHQADETWQGDSTVTADVITTFLSDVNAAFPALAVTPADIRFIHHGLVPAVVGKTRVDLMPEPRILTHPGAPGVVSLVGVKYTTARLAAERAVDALALARGSGRTGTALLPHADVADSDGLLVEVLRKLGRTLDRDVMRHLASWYGTEGALVVSASAEGDGLERLSPATPVLCGEVLYAARHTSAVRLADIVFRRTPLASAGHPGDAALSRAAALAAAALGWAPERTAEELELVMAQLDPSAIQDRNRRVE
jgi:glycerol-3-phosphate dehydrogenase